MTFVVRPGKYLIEKTRRSIVGVIALVGTGGSVPKPAQEALDAYTRSLAAAHGGDKTILSAERSNIREAMRKFHGWWLILSPAGLRWVQPGPIAAIAGADEGKIKTALKNAGWSSIPAAQLHLLMWGEPGEGVRGAKKK
jgi:hypothetical protein